MYLSVGESEGQRIGGIRGRWFSEVQHALNHFGDGELLSGAITDDGLLHLTGGKFIDIQTSFSDRGEGCAPGFAHDESCLEIVGEKEALNDAESGAMLRDDVSEGLSNFDETTGTFPGSRAGNRSVGDGNRMRFTWANDSIAGAAERGVHSQN